MSEYNSNMSAVFNGSLGLGGGDEPPVKKRVLYLPADTIKPTVINDGRKVVAATGDKMSNVFSKSGSYDTNTIKNVIKAAKFNNVDPNLALAVALQETGLGKNTTLDNVVHNWYGDAPKGLDRGAWMLTKELKSKIDEGKKLGFKDEALLIQMFNGMGRLYPQLRVNGVLQPQKMYGITVTKDKPLDMRKNPVYGKTVIDLRDNVIKSHPEIQSLIEKS